MVGKSYLAKTYCSNSPVESPPHNENRGQTNTTLELRMSADFTIVVLGLVVSLTGDMAGLCFSVSMSLCESLSKGV